MNKPHILKKTSVFFFILILLSAVGCKKKAENDVPLTRVLQGTFYLEIVEEGEIEAINSTSVTSPIIPWRFGNLKITQIVTDGAEVKAGDTLVVFDPSEVKRGVVDAEARLEMNIAELAKMNAQHQSDLEELKADLEIARINHEISKIRFESSGYEADIRRKEIKLNLDRAAIALERASEQIENRIRVQKEEVKQRQLSISQDRSRLVEANETLNRLFVISPSPGIAIISRNWTTGNKYQEGDQCWSGVPLIQLPDLSALKANVSINEVDISKISPGLSVEIKPDAFSDSTFTGRINTVANLAVNRNNRSSVKVFPVEIYINETNEKLLPGLTVSCRIILDRIENAIYVPIESVNARGSERFVYRKTASGYEKVVIETGESNRNYVVVLSGLSPGDEITLRDPFAKSDDSNNETPATQTL